MSRVFRDGRGRRSGGARRFRAIVERLEDRLLLSAVNVTSYHNDAASTGQNLGEKILTPANVNSTSFGKLQTTGVDGQVYAQPLYVSGVNVTAGAQPGTHNVTYVATEHDSLYAIDADTGTVLWQDSFLVTEPGLTGSVAVTTVPGSDTGSTDITPECGITSTPAIDASTGFMYVVANTKQVVNGDTTNPHYVYTLNKVNIQNGAFTSTLIGDTQYQSSTNHFTFNSGPSVLGSGDGTVEVNGNLTIFFNALRNLQRAAVTLNNGRAYLAFASHGDVLPYHGWILGYDESTLAATAVFCTNPNGDDCGIWQGGGKIAVDSQGFMYVETANGLFDGTLNAQGFPVNGDYGDSFLKLAVDPSTTAANPAINGWGLKVVDYFTPQNQQSLNFADTDLGSGGIVLLPATSGSVTIGSAAHPNLLIGAGKEGKIYVIDCNSMGRYDPNTDHVVQEMAAIGGAGVYGTPSFFFDGLQTRIYYVGSVDFARSFTISNAILAADTVSNDSYGSRQGSGSISADASANGILWDIVVNVGQLRAYNASNLTQELYTSAQAANSRDSLGTAVKFSVPTVANGHVYVGTSNALVIYGLLSPPTTAPVAPSNLTAAAVSGVQINLAWQDNSNNESGFSIEQSTDGGNSFTQVAIARVGASSYSITGLTAGTTYVYRVLAFNGAGNSAYTNTATATTISPTPALDFSSGFSNGASLLSLNGSAVKIIGSALQLTNATTNVASSVFSTSSVSVTRFTTSLSFQLSSATAEGLTFTIQRAGSTAVGASGAGLGYGGIATSVALKFDIFSDNGEGTDSTGVFINGATPSAGASSIDMTSSGLSLLSGNVIAVTLTYDGTTLQQTVTDTVTHATFTHGYAIDIPGTIGGTSAFVGFTASTGASTAIENVLSWSYTPLPAPPVAPTNLTVTPASGTELDLSWTQGSSPVDHFNILRLTAPNTYTQVGQVPGNVTTYPDSGLTPGTSYSYEVVAVNAGGSSPVAGPVGNTTPTPPAGPTNLQFSNLTSTSVTLTWQNNATNATGYKIVRQLGSNNSQFVVSLPANATSYNDSGLEPDAPYQYIVSAVNFAGPSTSANGSLRTSPLVVNGTANADFLNLVKDADQLHIDWRMGTSSGQLLITSQAGLTLNGGGGQDYISLDYSKGNPFPQFLHLNGSFTFIGMPASGALSGSTIDIGQSTVNIIYFNGASPASMVQHYLQNGYNAGTWNGAAPASDGAIVSSAAAAGPAGVYGVGYADWIDGVVSGQTANTVELRYTLMGDANLDRTVNSTDSLLMSRNYMVAGKTAWDQGNFNYDSTINMADALLLQKNFNATANGTVAPAGAGTVLAPAPVSSTITMPVQNTGDSDPLDSKKKHSLLKPAPRHDH
jgi:hypothetical protein